MSECNAETDMILFLLGVVGDGEGGSWVEISNLELTPALLDFTMNQYESASLR